MLDGEARDKWEAIVKKTTMRGRKDVKGVESSAPGKTLDTFDECIHKFKRLWFYPTHRSLTVQRDYLQHNIQFPTGKGLPLGEFVNRVININSKLREFPSPLGYSGNKFFSDEELKLIVLRALPRHCMSQVLKSGRSVDQFTMDSLREFLEVVLNDESRNEKKTGETRRASPAGTVSAKARRARTLARPSVTTRAEANSAVIARATVSPVKFSRHMTWGTALF